MSEAHLSPTSPAAALMPERVRRPVDLLISSCVLTLLIAAVSLAGAQVPVNQGCPPGAICHPQGAGMQFMDGMTAAADAVGRLFNNREKSGDCSGLGPEGCLGLVLHKVMCAIDNREWVQEYACADEASEGEASTTSAPVYTASRATASWLLSTMVAHKSDRPFQTIKLGDVGGFDFFLRGVFSFDERNQGEYFGILEAVDSTTGRSTQLMLGAVSDHVYAGHIDFFKARR